MDSKPQRCKKALRALTQAQDAGTLAALRRQTTGRSTERCCLLRTEDVTGGLAALRYSRREETTNVSATVDVVTSFPNVSARVPLAFWSQGYPIVLRARGPPVPLRAAVGIVLRARGPPY